LAANGEYSVKKLVIGCGYLGSRVATLWQQTGATVFATTRTKERMADIRQASFEPILCDVMDAASLQSLPKVDTVLFSVGRDRKSASSMREVYVTGLENVLQKLPLPGRFIYISSTGVYGQSAGEAVDEEAATDPADESGRVVLDAERALRRRLPEAIILRLAGIYGPNRLIRGEALQSGEPIVGDPDKLLNLIHVEDAAAAVLAAEERGRPGAIYNISDDAPIARGEFYRHLARLLHAPEPRFTEEPQPSSRRARTNRRIVNKRMHDELALNLRYPTYREGLLACLAAKGSELLS
jgi:nucleoside-diphosphate-sugar epimerase